MTETTASRRKWDFDRVFRLLLTVVTVVALYLLVVTLADVLIPFTVALLLAYLLNPIVTALETRLGRPIAVLVTVFGSGIVALSLAMTLVYVGSAELASARELVLGLVHRAEHRTDEPGASPDSTPESSPIQDGKAAAVEGIRGIGLAFQEFIDKQDNATIRRVLEEARDYIRSNRDDFLAQLEADDLFERAIGFVAPKLTGLVSGILSFVVGLSALIVVLLYLVFLLIDYPLFVKTWRGFLPPDYRADLGGFVDEFTLAMSRYFRGQFIIAAIVGILFAVGFKLVGIRMAILLGLGVGLLNMVPYLQTVALPPALFLGFVKGVETDGPIWLPMVLIGAVFVTVQLIQDSMLTPTIMGRTVGLRPVVLLLSIFIWGRLLGFLGLVIAIPLTCLGLAYYRRFVLGDMTAQAIQDG